MSTECDLCDKESVYAFTDGTRLCKECVVQAANHRGLLHEIKRLRQWKREATLVIEGWDNVWVAAGKPGQVGDSKAQAVKDEVARLKRYK